MRTIIIFINLLICATHMLAQTNYYTKSKTFYEDGYTYHCDVPTYKLVTLYNVNNRWVHTYPKYKDTGKTFVMPEEGIDLIEDDNWTDNKCQSIVNNAFSTTEKQRVKGKEFTISMYINTTTGKVEEVDFQFESIESYATIPVSVYRKIEIELKNNIWFTPTTEGKKLNYILYWWSQEPK